MSFCNEIEAWRAGDVSPLPFSNPHGFRKKLLSTVSIMIRTVVPFLFLLVLAGSSFAGEKPKSLFNGKDLSGWKVIAESNFENHGKVKIVEQAIHLEKGDPATGIVFTGKPPRENYEIQLQAKRTAGDDFFCGLTFPIGEEFCTLIIGGWGGGTTGLSNVDGYSAVDNSTTGYVKFKNDQWVTIRLRVTKANISAWVDKEQIVDLATKDRKFATWWEQEPAQPLGIAAWKTSAAVRNIQLRLLNGE